MGITAMAAARSALPESLLLDAAHIVADKDERLGQPMVANGILLSKIHHAASKWDGMTVGIFGLSGLGTCRLRRS
jgi:putative restriction endonuclease